MKKLIVRIATCILPTPLLVRTIGFWRSHRRRKFLQQGSTTLRLAGINLEIPQDHSLPGLHASQPLRDLCVGITARYTGQKYPEHTIIDIGANVGDTAAIMAENCQNPLLLVEASDFYHGYLVRNAEKINNATTIRKVLVADGSSTSGELFHWGGTAEWKESDSGAPTPTQRLSDLTDAPVCMVKSDTDGHDFKILQSAIEWLVVQKPTVLFESSIANSTNFSDLVSLVESFRKAEYMGFVLWDDAGIHLLSTTDHHCVIDTHRYLLKCHEYRSGKGISNLDVACFHSDNMEIFEKVSEFYRIATDNRQQIASKPIF